MGFVVADGIHEILDLFHKGIKVVENSHLPLDESQADHFLGGIDEGFLFRVVDIVPFK